MGLLLSSLLTLLMLLSMLMSFATSDCGNHSFEYNLWRIKISYPRVYSFIRSHSFNNTGKTDAPSAVVSLTSHDLQKHWFYANTNGQIFRFRCFDFKTCRQEPTRISEMSRDQILTRIKKSTSRFMARHRMLVCTFMHLAFLRIWVLIEQQLPCEIKQRPESEAGDATFVCYQSFALT